MTLMKSAEEQEAHSLTPAAEKSPASENLPAESRLRPVIVKVLLLAGLVAAFWYFSAYHREELTLERIAQRRAQFDAFRQQHPLGVYGVAFLIYVVVTGLSLPGAAVLTLSYGWFFGFVRAVILVSFASTTGATLAFLLSRYLFRDLIQRKFGDRLQTINESLQKEGAYYLFTLRLIPAVPFFVINAVMGLTPMRVRTYWWVSQLGMLPGTCVYVLAGSQIPSAEELVRQGVGGIMKWQMWLAFALLGIFPLVVKRAMRWWSARRPVENPLTRTETNRT